ncbi:hypothetical protein GQ55_5G406000 [Panicum hallii var. hallii]|uniref:Uncharacterized protein n=1 Tax=Panicum hallii var. hallii TaxID=1504633 RepID=A0A2T7DNJ8_9POAL|nr:hypothetical protein GQ55_5G406000 [Panicum hallii var. hallii]
MDSDRKRIRVIQGHFRIRRYHLRRTTGVRSVTTLDGKVKLYTSSLYRMTNSGGLFLFI